MKSDERRAEPTNSEPPILATDVIFLQSGASAVMRTAQDKMRDIISVKDFGAIGDGATDDTLAIRAALAYSRTQNTTSGGGGTGQPTQPMIYFPPGQYKVTDGITQSGGMVQMFGDFQQAKIIMEGTFVFLSVSGIVNSTYVKGLHFVGGQGAIRYSNTGNNVTGSHVIEDCIFDNYTQCAVGQVANDMPYWYIRRNMFYADSMASQSIGLLLSGGMNRSCIDDNDFMLNTYHLKLANPGGDINIRNNDFIMFQPGIRKADIWVVPTASSNGGSPMRLHQNKFGNENGLPTDVRVLFANQNSTDSFAAQPDVTNTTGFVRDFQLRENFLAGSGNGDVAPFIDSYVNNTRGLYFDKENIIEGAGFAYFCRMNSFNANEFNGEWFIEAPRVNGDTKPWAFGVSNHAMGFHVDEFGWYQALPNTVMTYYSSGDDANFSELLNTNGSLLSATAASLTATTDVYGGTTAALVTFTASASTSSVFSSIGMVSPGTQCFVEFDIGGPDANSVRAAVVDVVNVALGSNNASALRRRIPLSQAGLQTARIPFVVPATQFPNNSDLRFGVMTSTPVMAAQHYALVESAFTRGGSRSI